jgi:hypothetical protein
MNLLIQEPSSSRKEDFEIIETDRNFVLSCRHYDVHQLCESARDSLQKAQSAWQNVASSYGDKPWLASDSAYKASVEEHWYSCGTKLEMIYGHPDVLPESGGHPSYYEPVQSCKVCDVLDEASNPVNFYLQFSS